MTAPARTPVAPARVPSGRPAPAGTRRGTARSGGSLRLVPPSIARARRTPFVAVVLGLLALGLLGMLALNTVLAQDAFRLHALQVQGKVLADREQALQTSVDALQAPRAIATRAQALGMVPGGAPDFLRLPDGVLLGADQAPPGAAQPDLVGTSAVPPPTATAAADDAQAAQAETADQARPGPDGTAGSGAGAAGTAGSTAGSGAGSGAGAAGTAGSTAGAAGTATAAPGSTGTGAGSTTSRTTGRTTSRTTSRSTTGTTSGSTR